jgi:predicted negative regulator of RcsB-dependent stress response
LGAKRIKVTAKKTAEPGPKKTIESVPLKLNSLEEFKLWVDFHQKQLWIAGGVILLILLAIWGYAGYSNSVEKSARAAYAPIFESWPREDAAPSEWEPLLPALDKFLSEYGSSKVALNARADKARVLFHLGKVDEAEDLNRKLLSELPAGSDLRPFVMYRLAIDAGVRGKNDEAAKYWTQLKDEGFEGYKREADWNLGRIAEKKGDLPGAAGVFEEALNSPGAYPPAAQIQESLDTVKRKIAAASPPKAEAPKAEAAKTEAPKP